MSDKLKAELEAIFNAHDEARAQAKNRQSEKEQREAEFLLSFERVRESLIRPTLETIVDHMKARGHKCRIEAKDEKAERDGRYEAPKISILFLVDDDGKHHASSEYPRLSIICEKVDSRLHFHESTMSPGRGGHAGGTGVTTLDRITADLINEKVLKVIKEVFR